jgi:pSer/pThr/pTyr-binding forkhead associated (FHA) protein
LNSLSKRLKGLELCKSVVTFGRFPDNDFQVIDQRLSLKHCRILRKLSEDTGKMVVVLEDSSSNGTFLNGELVSNRLTGI